MKTHLMIHHSLTRDSSTVSWDAIRKHHVEHNGWRDIGYHLGVELIGGHYEMLVGRPLTDRAAAAYQQGMNSRAIHVCFVGNFDEAPPSKEILQFAAPHLAAIMDVFDIPPENVIGHRDVAPYKSCPGKQFYMDPFRTLLGGA